jgi:lycopene cyclase domain-containing protein
MPVYLLFIAVFFWLPLALLWGTHRALLWRYRKTIALVVLPTFVFGVPWDILSVVTGLWWYNTGVPSLNVWLTPWLPLEEFLFTATYPLWLASGILVLRAYLKRLTTDGRRQTADGGHS